MQWKSFVFILATAGSALARSQGQHKHRHDVRHEHEVATLEARAVEGAASDLSGLFDLEPITVTATVSECCTTNAFSLPPTSVAPATFIEIPSETTVTTVSPVETSTSTLVPTETSTTTSTSVKVPTAEPEPVTTSSTVAPTTTAAPSAISTFAESPHWTFVPSNVEFCTEGFGERTSSTPTDSKITYAGNVGIPWGSNIIEVSAETASKYKYVVQFKGSKTDKWTVVVWNKIGPDGGMTGWYGNSAVKFSLEAGEIRYVAFDENSQGSWGAAKGDSLPTDQYGGYSCTWGEFDFGNAGNGEWSGWDVSAIQAQAAGQAVQGMKICSAAGDNCSIITTGAARVFEAYQEKDKYIDGIGGKVPAGAVRVVTHLDYNE